MAEWFRQSKKGLQLQQKRSLPDNLWIKCEECKEIIYKKELDRNLWVCPECGGHFRINSTRYIDILLDSRSFQEFGQEITSQDPLHFVDKKSYSVRLKEAIHKGNMTEAVRTGFAKIEGLALVIALMDFDFMGGSMGSVVGEKIARAIQQALDKKWPLIIVSCSGGARMQEGIFSLMQMAKTSAMLALLSEQNIPYISLISHPTTGGVTASFAMLGDIIISEPNALIGFAGPRVIQETLRQSLPDGFQRSEFVQEHGFIDLIVERKKLKETLHKILSFFQ